MPNFEIIMIDENKRPILNSKSNFYSSEDNKYSMARDIMDKFNTKSKLKAVSFIINKAK